MAPRNPPVAKATGSLARTGQASAKDGNGGNGTGIPPAGESSFAELVADVTPLVPNKRRVAGARPPVAQPHQPTGATRASTAMPRASPPGPWHQGNASSQWRDGVNLNDRRRLRQGKLAVEGRLDLHGLYQDEARVRLLAFLAACHKNGMRCVEVIHGKGLHSPGEPVLRARVPDWLVECDAVLGFCGAPSDEGGVGALRVLLRRS